MWDLWCKCVKNDWLCLKFVGKDDLMIVEMLDKCYDYFQKCIVWIKSEDVFQIFMNVYIMVVEFYINYMGLWVVEDFNILMKLFLVGIGVVLVDKDEYVMIWELIVGGFVVLLGQLQVGDCIVGVV